MNKLNQEIHANLAELARLVREAGDHDTSERLDDILQSPNQIKSLHDAFARKLCKSKRHDTSASDRQKFFTTFKSADGTRLTGDQVKNLVSVTNCWRLEQDQICLVKLLSSLWARDPSLFWNGSTPDQNIIRRSFDDLERMREVDPLRRKVLLVTLSQNVRSEQKRKGKEYSQQRKRIRSRATKSLRLDPGGTRNPLLLTSSLGSLCHELWPGLDEATTKKRREWVSTYSLSGWKWEQLEDIGMILSLRYSASKKFERRKWECIEFKALNAYVKTLPQYIIKSELERAWKSIISFYRGEWNANAEHSDHEPDEPCSELQCGTNGLVPDSQGNVISEGSHAPTSETPSISDHSGIHALAPVTNENPSIFNNEAINAAQLMQSLDMIRYLDASQMMEAFILDPIEGL